jgi:transcriptional regulator with XRE-family HTH domain
MTPAQCRAARALLGMSQSQLGFVAVVPLGLIIDFEAEATTPEDEDLDALQDALERAGVEFIGGDGVKLRPAP